MHTFTIPTFGDHNVLNALAVIALCHYENIDVKCSKGAIKNIPRRENDDLQKKELVRKLLVDDYAHHPTEIQATIDSARQKYPNKEIVAVFQPHTFTRTQTFLDEFAESLESSGSSIFM